jgi:uncharacterized protein YkwD
MQTAFLLAVISFALFATLTPASALTLNAFRSAHHLPALHQSAALDAAARRHAADMARRDHLDHDGFFQRMSGYTRAAENVAVIACARRHAKPVSTFAGRACGCATSDCAYRMWASSSGHRRNMVLGGLTLYGLASAKSAGGRRFWVLELAGERPVLLRVRTAAHRRHARKHAARRHGRKK